MELKGLLPLLSGIRTVPELREDAILGYKKHQLMVCLVLSSGAVLLMCKYYALNMSDLQGVAIPQGDIPEYCF